MFKYLDIVVMCIFVMWVGTLDFNNTTWKTWLAGAVLIGYIVYYAIRNAREKTKQKNAGKQ